MDMLLIYSSLQTESTFVITGLDDHVTVWIAYFGTVLNWIGSQFFRTGSGRQQQTAVQNPYCIDALPKLPVFQSIFAAYHLEVGADICAGKRLDSTPVLGLNKVFYTLHIPAPTMFGNGGFAQAFQVVIEESSRRTRYIDGSVGYQAFRGK